MSQTTPVVETVSRKRIIPADEVERKMPECWEYLETLKPDEWHDHIVYLYRQEPKASTFPGAPAAFLDKYVGTIEVRPGYNVPMDDAGNIQQAIKEKFGGRVFRLIVKRGNQRVTEGTFSNEAPPKYPNADPFNPQQQPPHHIPMPASDASVASKAIDAMASQQPDAMRLAMDVLRSASEIVLAKNPAPHPSESSFIDRTVINTLLQRALDPPPPPPQKDPLELFLRFKEIMQPAATNGVKETLDLIGTLKNSGLLTSGGKTSLLDLGREVIPQVASTAKEAIHEWRLGVEAQVRGMELSRGMNPQPPAAPLAVGPPASAASAPAAAPAAAPHNPATDEANGIPPFDWLAIKIVEILKEPSYTVDEAVDEALSFLYRSHAPIVGMLLDPPKIDARLMAGPQGLLQLFQNHVVLKTVPVNPRLVEFIEKFIAGAKEAEAQRTTPAAAAAPAPAPPAEGSQV